MKRNSPAFIILIVVLVFIRTAGLSAQEKGEAPRTYYDALNLDTPEAAAQTFVEAFQQLDFLTVYMILSPQTQKTIDQNFNLLRFHDVVNRRVNLRDFLFDGEVEQVGTPFLFDWIMMRGVAEDGLLIDLQGDVEFGALRHAYSPTGDWLVEIPATVESIDGEVRFHLVMSPGGRWRVHQVIAPGGDEERFPWAAQPPFIVGAIALWETPCDDTPPEQSTPSEQQPYLVLTPACGESTEENRTQHTLLGFNFEPEILVEVWVRDAQKRSRPVNVKAFTNRNGAFVLDFMIPWRDVQPGTTMEVVAQQVIQP